MQGQIPTTMASQAIGPPPTAIGMQNEPQNLKIKQEDQLGGMSQNSDHNTGLYSYKSLFSRENLVYNTI